MVWGHRFDPSELLEAHETVRAAYESGRRVRVEPWHGATAITGRVSTSAGWLPRFVLVTGRRARDARTREALEVEVEGGRADSLIVLTRGARVIAVSRGGRYVDGSEGERGGWIGRVDRHRASVG